MFRASLCPSSGALDWVWFSVLDVLAGVLGSREAVRVHCAQLCTVHTCAPEDGHNDARNMLS